MYVVLTHFLECYYYFCDSSANPTRTQEGWKAQHNQEGQQESWRGRSRNNKKSSLNIGSDLLSQKIYQTMEKHNIHQHWLPLTLFSPPLLPYQSITLPEVS